MSGCVSGRKKSQRTNIGPDAQRISQRLHLQLGNIRLNLSKDNGSLVTYPSATTENPERRGPRAGPRNAAGRS